MSGSRAEAGTATIKAMLVAARSGYPRDKSRLCSSGGGGGIQGRGNWMER